MNHLLRYNLGLLLIVAGIFILAGFASALPLKTEQDLVGSWKLVENIVDAEGNPCPFIPDGIELFVDETLTMSNMPDRRMPYKTSVSTDDRSAIEARIPGLKGMPLLLIKPMPQMEWQNTPMIYGYSLNGKKDILKLTLPGWTPASFQRVK